MIVVNRNEPHPLRDFTPKLGRRERSIDLVKINVRDFVDVEKAKHAIANPPVQEEQTVDFTTLVTSWPMFLNDSLGDCTVAGFAHSKEIFDAATGTSFTVTDTNVEVMYEASGYSPSDPSTDQGWTLQAAAEYGRTIGLMGTQASPVPDIVAYAEVSLNDEDAQQIAMELFGGLYIGVELPNSAMTQFQNGQVWVPTSDTSIDGGHCMVRAKKTLHGTLLYVTWGTTQEADDAWEKEFCDEMMALVAANWEQKMPQYLVEAGVVDFGKLQSLVNQFGN